MVGTWCVEGEICEGFERRGLSTFPRDQPGPLFCSDWWKRKPLFEIPTLGEKKEQNTSEVSEIQNQTQALSWRAEDHPLSCFTWVLWLGQSPSVACASSPVWGQEDTRSKLLWEEEGKQGKDALCFLPGAAMGQETEARKDEKAQQPHSPASRSTSWQVDGCMWRKRVLALEMAAPVLLSGHLLFSLLSLCACARASDCIWIIWLYLDYLFLPPSSPPSSSVLSLYQRGAWLLLCAFPRLALGSAWLQRAVISQPALLSSSQWHHPLWLYKAQGGSLYLCVLFAHSFSCLSVQHTCKSHCRNWAFYCLNQNCTAEKGVGA